MKDKYENYIIIDKYFIEEQIYLLSTIGTLDVVRQNHLNSLVFILENSKPLEPVIVDSFEAGWNCNDRSDGYRETLRKILNKEI